MLGQTFVWAIHVHGTLAEDIVAHYKLPCAATLVRVDTCSVADAEGSLVVGTTANADAYLLAHTPGHNATFSTKDRGDFDGDLSGHDTAECPHIAKDTVLELTYTHNDANTNVDIALTFEEG